MKLNKITLFCAVLTLATAQAEVHSFLDKEGRVIKGEIVSVYSSTVSIKLADSGKTYSYERERFESDDQDYIKAWDKSHPRTSTNSTSTTRPSTSSPAVAEPKAPGAPLAWRMETKTLPRKSTKNDRLQILTVSTSVRNTETKPIEGGKAVLLVFAKNLASNTLNLLQRDEFPIDLKAGASTSHEAPQIALEFYESAYSKYGKKYEGYLLYIVDKDNRLLKTEASSTNYPGNLANAALLKARDNCTKDLRLIGERSD
jgi:hypothetical protein